jgi:hypothetical protein
MFDRARKSMGGTSRFACGSIVIVAIGSCAIIACTAHNQSFLGPSIAAPTIAAPDAIDDPIRLAFDRFLNPASISPETILLQDSTGTQMQAVINYDPVTLTIALSKPSESTSWLTAGQSYQVVLNTSTPSGSLPLQAIDGAKLSQSVTLPFTVGSMASGSGGEPSMHFCVDVLPILQNKCAYGPCHVTPQNMGASAAFPDGESRPAQGLILDSSIGVASTAVNQTAHGSNTSGTAGELKTLSTPFGIDMPIIDPGSPGNSWLMYKTLLALPPAQDDMIQGVCGPEVTASTFGSDLVSPVTIDERARLSNFILGREMPYPTTPSQGEPSANPGDNPLSIQELERVRAWIEQGATVDDCNMCAATN